MALTSPGVQVTVNDESFYTPAEAGTTPLVIVATAQDKSNASGTGIAKGTLAANIGKVYRVSSQRELVEFYGTPVFKKTVSGSPRHGDEQNEYGLQAAYSFLGISNTAYIARADINLDDLTGTSTVPGSEATDGQWWLDTQSTKWGIFEWDATPADLGGQKFVAKTPIVLSASDSDKINSGAPVASVGKVGDYAVVAETDVIRYYYKGKNYTQASTSAAWHLIGTPGWRGTSPAITATTAGYTRGEAYKFLLNNVSVSIGSNQTAQQVADQINGYNPQGVRAGVINNRVAFFVVDHTNEGDSTNNDVSITFAQSLDGTQPTITQIFGFDAGVYYAPELAISAHTSVPQWKSTSQYPKPSGSVWVKATEPNQGARWRIKRWNDSSKAWVEVTSPLYADGHNAVYGLDKVAGGQNIVKDSLYVQYNYTEDSGYDNTPQTAAFKIFVRRSAGSVSITSAQVTDTTPGTTGSKSFTIRESILGSKLLGTVVGSASPAPQTITFTWTAGDGTANVNAIAEAVNSSNLTNIEATVANNKLTLTHKLGGEFRLLDTSGILAAIGFVGFDITANEGTINLYDAPQGESYDFIASGWLPLAGSATGYVADMDPPLNEPTDGQYWYSNSLSEVDIMVHDGDAWVGYQNEFPDSDPNGPIIGATKPTLQSDGTALAAGDLWIDTSDLESYPIIYRWNTDTLKWTAIDTGDSTSEDGILFADARWTTGPGAGTESSSAADLADLRINNFLDPDAPDPELYPKGILLWNTRRSGFNVKVYRENYINTDDDNARQNGESMIDYYPSRWVTMSGSSFGRKAQRLVVVEALKEVISTNQEIREDEVRSFNLIACPGYPEVLQNMVDLNNDRGGTAFVVGDSPLRLPSDTTSLTAWGSNSNAATDNGDAGLVTYDAYSAVFYPSGLTNDNTGSTVVVPASHMMLKTMALSDQVSYPWFAPAGLRRGAITNATSVGYIDKTTGEFKSVSLTEGQRDALYGVKINPLTFFNGVGLVNYGQRTRSAGSSALDRINVARLVVFLRSQLNKLAKPYVFEPNDKITRDEIKQAIESLLLELVGLRAIYDYAVVCDETNNTPARIDRNELYVDIAIEPVKAIEFIYIPLRLKNTGEIQGARAS